MSGRGFVPFGFLSAVLGLAGLVVPPPPPRASYPTKGKRKANPVKKAARKRQRKARQITRGVR